MSSSRGFTAACCQEFPSNHTYPPTHTTQLIVRLTTDAIWSDKCFHQEVEERKGQYTNPICSVADLGYTNPNTNALNVDSHTLPQWQPKNKMLSYRSAAGPITYLRSISQRNDYHSVNRFTVVHRGSSTKWTAMSCTSDGLIWTVEMHLVINLAQFMLQMLKKKGRGRSLPG